MAEVERMAREMVSPRHVRNRRRRAREGSRTCVCANTFSVGVAQGGKSEINVLPWYRLCRRGKNLQLDARRQNQAARKGKWSPRCTGTTVLTYPGNARARLVKTVKIQVRWAAHPWTRPSAPGCGGHTQGSSGLLLDLGW